MEVADAPDVWATDSVPVSSGDPIEWNFERSGASTREGVIVDGDGPEPPVAPGTDRSKTWIGLAVGAVAVLAIGIIAWPDGDSDETVDSGPQTTQAELGTLPSIDVSDDETDEPDAVMEDVDEPDAATSTPLLDDDVVSNGGGGLGDELSVLLPPEVAAIREPTEIVLRSGGLLHTLSLPSGEVRTVDLGASNTGSGSPLAIGPDATLVDSSQNTIIVVPRVGVPISVDISEFGSLGSYTRSVSTRADGTTVFDVSFFTNSGGINASARIDSSGNLEVIDPDEADDFGRFGYSLSSAPGQRLVTEAGGVYTLADDGTATRVSTGQAFAADGSGLLARECDDAMQCGFVLIDLASGERRPLGRDDSFDIDGYDVELAPDHTAVAYTESSATSQNRVILDFELGAVASAEGTVSFRPSSSAWAGDSSGVFAIAIDGSALIFVDRASGKVVEFGSEFGRVTSIGVRRPDAELPPKEGTADDRSDITLSRQLVADTGLELVAVGDVGAMAYIDIDDLSAVSWSTPSPGRLGVDAYVSGGDVIVLDQNGDDSFVTRFDEWESLNEDVVGIPGGSRLPGPDISTVWTEDKNVRSGVGQVVTSAVGALVFAPRQVTLPNAQLLGGDGRGELVVELGGDIFVTTESASEDGGDGNGGVVVASSVELGDLELLTSGELLAISADWALARTCDPTATCRLTRIDRSTGAESDITAPIALITGVGAAADRSVALRDTVSPDGRTAVIEIDPDLLEGSESAWVAIDLESGSLVTQLPEPTRGQPIVWSPDGQNAAFVADRSVQVWQRYSGSVATVGQTGNVTAIVAAPDGFVPQS